MAKSQSTLQRAITSTWVDQLSHYRRHRHQEHVEALFDEARRFAGIQLENDLTQSVYWSIAPLPVRAALMLYMVDRRLVERVFVDEQVIFRALPGIEAWVASQPELADHIVPALEFVAALRNYESRRALKA